MRYVLIAMLLTSCGLNPQYMDNKAKRATQRHMLQCEEMGYKRDTEEFRKCVMEMHKNTQKIEVR